MHRSEHRPTGKSEPRSTETAATKKTEAHKPEDRRPIRVMLVDDHVILREGLASLLATEPDLRIIGQAGDGIAAFEMAIALRPDVILMDVKIGRAHV